MKKTLRIVALLLAVLMTITSFAAIALAEGEETETSSATSNEGSSENSTESSTESSGDESSGDESSGDESSGDESSGDESSGTEPPAVTANIVINGVPADAINVYFNDVAVSGTYSGDAGAIAIRVEAKDGYEITSAEYKIPYLGAVKLTEENGKYSVTTYEFSEGASFTLTVNAQIVPKMVDLKITDNGEEVYIVKANGQEADLTEYGVMTGDIIEITFKGEGEFNPDLAWLSVNGVVTEMTSFTYSFEITDNTNIVFYYGTVPVTVTLKGPVKLEFQKTVDSSPVDSVTNNGTGTVIKTLNLTKDESYKIIVTPAQGYELSGGVVISEPDRTVDNNGVYFFRPSGATTVDVTMKKSANGGNTTTDDYTVRVNVGMGGKVEVDGHTVLGGMGTNVVVKKGEDLEFIISPDEGYLVDVFRINGETVEITDNKYTIENVDESSTVSISFKSEEPVDTDDAIGVDDIVWTTEPIVVDIRGGKLVKREVLDKIATLSGDGKYVEFKSENGSLYIPYGGRSEGSSNTANLAVAPLTSGTLYDVISNAINNASGGDAVYKAFSFNVGFTLPVGTQVSFLLGSEFVGSTAVMLLYNSADSGFFTKENASLPLDVATDGTVGKFAYDNEGILICSKEVIGSFTIESVVLNEGGFINPEGTSTVHSGESLTYYISTQEGYTIKQILVDGEALESVEGLKSYNYTFENITESHTIKVEFISDGTADGDSGNGRLTTVIVIMVIAFVAIAGAAALFIVKWRQEKF